ncbi:MAG: hypothetical protein CVU11_10100 [Bacteroidetes bacterium HGW-Bacteroidetes-6]|jgi:hypothetical protein|nr:MAG: hypothetical protein CVU11_10100 [Bacteroidetes bacterium HGW-Bacteroidetes-6]
MACRAKGKKKANLPKSKLKTIHTYWLLEVTRKKQIENETRLSEIFLKRGYHDVTMKTENGSIVVTNITTKTRLNP